MSFAENLWGKQDMLHNRFKIEMSCYTNILNILTYYKDAINTLSKTFRWIMDKQLQVTPKSETTLGKATEELYSLISRQSTIYSEISEYFDQFVIEPYKSQIDSMIQQEKDKYYEVKRTLAKYIDAESAKEKAKSKFYFNAKIAETAKVDAEKIKGGMTNQLDKDKSLQHADLLIRSAKDYENLYTAALKYDNESRLDYIAKAYEAFEIYQRYEHDYNEGMHKVISLYFAGMKKMCFELLRLMDPLENMIGKIDSNNDLAQFFKENKSTEKPPEEIPFEPYEPITKFEKTMNHKGLSHEMTYEVLNTFKQNFTMACKNFDPDEEKEKLVIKKLSEKIFTSNIGFCFSQEEREKLIDYIKKKNYRSTFLQVLNKQRYISKYHISRNLFEVITEILLLILDLSKESNDFECPENCIILSQTFYIEEEKGEKIYLIKMINQHPLLTSIDFWKGLIEVVIRREMSKHYVIGVSKNELKSAMGNIVFSQLLPYTNNMLEFEIEKEKIMAVIDAFAVKYELNNSLKETVIKNVEERIESSNTI